MFSCKFCEISENNFFTEQLWTTASAPRMYGLGLAPNMTLEQRNSLINQTSRLLYHQIRFVGTVFVLQHLLHPSITASGLLQIQESLKGR